MFHLGRERKGAEEERRSHFSFPSLFSWAFYIYYLRCIISFLSLVWTQLRGRISTISVCCMSWIKTGRWILRWFIFSRESTCFHSQEDHIHHPVHHSRHILRRTWAHLLGPVQSYKMNEEITSRELRTMIDVKWEVRGFQMALTNPRRYHNFQ